MRFASATAAEQHPDTATTALSSCSSVKFADTKCSVTSSFLTPPALRKMLMNDLYNMVSHNAWNILLCIMWKPDYIGLGHSSESYHTKSVILKRLA